MFWAFARMKLPSKAGGNAAEIAHHDATQIAIANWAAHRCARPDFVLWRMNARKNHFVSAFAGSDHKHEPLGPVSSVH